MKFFYNIIFFLIMGSYSFVFPQATFELHCVGDTIVNSRTLFVHEFRVNDTLFMIHYYGIDGNYVKRYGAREPGGAILWHNPVPTVVKISNISIGDWWYNKFNGNTAIETVTDTISIYYNGNDYFSYKVVGIDSATSSHVITRWYSEDFGLIQVYNPFFTTDTMKIISAQIVGGFGALPLSIGNRWTFSIITNMVSSNLESQLNFYLYPNYPNPFNPSTKIKYSVAKMSFVTLKVFDVLGNEVATLVNEEKLIGTYEITWNATDLSSGIYFYRIQAGNYTESKKLVLVR